MMMRTRKILPIIFLAILFYSACSDDNTTDFVANLTGANVVPPVDSSATGRADFTLDESENTIQFFINLTDTPEPFAAHIYAGAAGVNGNIVVTLYNNPLLPGNFSGRLAAGVIRSSDVSGMTFNELVQNMRAGQVYVSVRTTRNQQGEIRGQIQLK